MSDDEQRTHDVFCPTCNVMVEARVIARAMGGYQSGAANPLDEVDAEYHGDFFSVAVCRRCEGPFLIREALFGVPGEFETVTDTAILFPQSSTSIADIPEAVSRALEQAHRSFSTASYDACVLMCRRALEATCRALSVSGKNLARKLEALEADGHIDARLLEWAHGVRLVGNDAAHEFETEVSREDARDTLDLLEALLMYVFTLDRKFRAFAARRNPPVGEAHDNNDGQAESK